MRLGRDLQTYDPRAVGVVKFFRIIDYDLNYTYLTGNTNRIKFIVTQRICSS